MSSSASEKLGNLRQCAVGAIPATAVFGLLAESRIMLSLWIEKLPKGHVPTCSLVDDVQNLIRRLKAAEEKLAEGTT